MKSLKAGIDNYIMAFTRKDLPKTLRGQKHRIFANIKSLYSFHQYEFLPRLLQCSDDPEQIAEVFTSFLTKDFFYGYIIYAINRKRSEQLCNYDQAFWKVSYKALACERSQNSDKHETLQTFMFLENPKRMRRQAWHQLISSSTNSKTSTLSDAFG